MIGRKLLLDNVYREGRRRISDLVIALTDCQLILPVPATPEWTVHDLLCHLVGGAADIASGRVDNAGKEHWTARHVAERQGRSVDQLLTEWAHVSPTVEKSLKGQRFTGPSLAPDLICHEADLRETLKLAPADREYWHDPFLEVMMLRLDQRLQNVMTVLVADEHGQQWQCGSGDTTTRLHTDGYELLRAMFSRRSRKQIAAWNWTPIPTGDVIDCFGVFGPRDDDQPIPRLSHGK